MRCDDHVNPRKLWQEMGSPEYLKKPDIDRLRDTARLTEEKGEADLCFTVPEYGVLAMDIEF